MSWKSVYRRLLRAAREHDSRPNLKSLLPLTDPLQEFPWCHPSAPSLSAVFRHAARHPPDTLQHDHRSLMAALKENTLLLEYNIKGRSIRHALGAERAMRPPQGRGPHPNLGWYHERMEDALLKSAQSLRRTNEVVEDEATASPENGPAVAAAAAAGRGGRMSPSAEKERRASAGLEPLLLLHEMIQVGVTPPRRAFESCIGTLACEPSRFEVALRAMWLMEAPPCKHPLSPHVISVLVKGALRTASLHTEGGEQQAAAAWRALGILESLKSTTGLYPASEACVTEVVEACAMRCSSARDLQRVQSLVQVATQDRVRITDTAYNALLEASERFGDRQDCIQLVTLMRDRGWSANPKTILHLYEWCIEEQDMDGAAILEEELVKSGKAEYLMSLNSQRC